MKNNYVSQIDDTGIEYLENGIKEFPEDYASDVAEFLSIKIKVA